MIATFRHLVGLVGVLLPIPRRSDPRKPRPSTTIARSSREATSPKAGPYREGFWLALRRLWSEWKHSLIVVTPQTVIRWHRAGFRLYWAWLSRHPRGVGRRPLTKHLRDLIQQMVAENPTWGAPRIHGELLMLGFDVSERSVSRWVKRCKRNPDPAKQWLAFLKNHRDSIAAMDFFTGPTLTFGVLHCWFVIGHDRRRILHYNVTRNPSGFWTVLQLMQTWQFSAPPKFLVFDRDAKFSAEVLSTIKELGLTSVHTASAVLGKTELLNAGSEAFAENYSTM